jgi:ABC-2 type transport system ATP-binding protein
MQAVTIASGLNIDSNNHSSIDNQLKISGLSKTYHNGLRALNNVNLTLSNGMFGLLGPNGAGKSSFMRSLATLQTFDNGSIIFNGEDSQVNPDAIRKCVGYLPQEFGVYPKMSAGQLLDYLAVLKVNQSHRTQK